jgi:hypothetical protein
MEADPGETKNVIADPAYAKTLAQLRGELSTFFRESGAPDIEDWRTTSKQHAPTYKAPQP